MEKFKSLFKKYWIALWMIFAVAAVFTTYVSGEYISNQNREKRVIANIGDTGKRFSSDRLTPLLPVSTYEVPFPNNVTGIDICPVTFQLFNHSLTDTSKRYQDEIYYVITAELKDHNGNAVTRYDADNPFPTDKFGIKNFESNYYEYFTAVNQIMTLEGHFEKNEEQDNHIFYICFPRTMITEEISQKVYIELTATPYSDSEHTQLITELDVLRARLSVMAQATSIDKGWTGSFQDSGQPDLDGLTFVFSGSGTSKLVLSYRSDLFEVNKFFLNDHSDDPTNAAYDSKFIYEDGYYYKEIEETVDGNTVKKWMKYTDSSWKTIIINADSNDENRYDIQLYMKDPDISKYMNNEGTGLDWTKITGDSGYIHSNANAPVTAETALP